MKARLIDVGKRFGRVSTEQRFINRALVEAARTGGPVVRLKGGDPLVFGRAQEEIDALRAAGIEVVVVPGVTAALAAGAELGEGEDASDWATATVSADTAFLYMASGKACAIARTLIAAGKPGATPVAIVEGASLASSRRLVGTLDDLARQAPALHGGPAILALGAVFAGARGEALALPIDRRALPA